MCDVWLPFSRINRVRIFQQNYEKQYRIHLLYDSLEEIDDETLQNELTRRGYNVTRQRENETTAEIIRIG